VSLLPHLLRVLYGRYVPEPVRNSLRLNLVLLQRDREPLRRPAPTGRCVVLAPHMDDEVFGCGATIAKAAAGGATVTTIFMTDGSKGSATPGPELVETRKEESRRAAKILGYDSVVYLDLPDSALACTSQSVGRLANALQDMQPDAVFLPFLNDIHHDHWLTNVIFAEAAVAAALRPGVTCWGYEVWIPAPVNTVVDVTDTFELKARAMEEFVSQDQYDYRRAMVALNTYRSLFTARGAGFAEGFYVADLPLYLGLYRAAAVGVRPPRGPGARPLVASAVCDFTDPHQPCSSPSCCSRRLPMPAGSSRTRAATRRPSRAAA
jgi:LmbE family N-acetylglucosaminyl deacetylase